jgi:protein KRI1
MPRKKSAAKKAREVKEREEQEKLQTVAENGKKQIDLGESDGSENELEIDEEYAKRFQHNKEREELDRLKEKHKNVDLDESSSSEDEDEYGELLTEDIDQGINQVLKTIRENPDKLLDKGETFFKPVDETDVSEKKKDSKPMHLKDYHRMNYLNGGVAEDEDDDGEKPYAVQQKIDQDEIIRAIHEDDEGSEEEDFLTKREHQPEIEPVELDKSDEKNFLDSFINNKGWLPKNVDKKTGKEVVPSYKDIVEEDDEEFDDIADKFESAYNFRYEDPNAAQIVSYARDQNTIRRKEESSRKRQREKKKEQKREEENKYKEEINKLKKAKTKEVLSKLEQLKEVLGDDEVSNMFTEKDLEGDFDGSEWDRRMQEVFNNEFYSKSDTKPTWADDDDDGLLDDIEDEEGQVEEAEEAPKSKNKAKKEEKQKKKEEKKEALATAEKIVDENIDAALEDAKIKKPDSQPKFRYREVSPESFGLSSRDILLASDKDLNEYVGLKKLASYRDQEKKQKDNRKYSKKRRLKEWRKSVFNDPDGPDEEALEAALNDSKPNKKRKHK